MSVLRSTIVGLERRLAECDAVIARAESDRDEIVALLAVLDKARTNGSVPEPAVVPTPLAVTTDRVLSDMTAKLPDQPTGGWDVDTQRQRVLDELMARGVSNAKDISEATGIDRQAVNRVLFRLRRHPNVHAGNRRGEYVYDGAAPTPIGPPPVDPIDGDPDAFDVQPFNADELKALRKGWTPVEAEFADDDGDDSEGEPPEPDPGGVTAELDAQARQERDAWGFDY